MKHIALTGRKSVVIKLEPVRQQSTLSTTNSNPNSFVFFIQFATFGSEFNLIRL